MKTQHELEVIGENIIKFLDDCFVNLKGVLFSFC